MIKLMTSNVQTNPVAVNSLSLGNAKKIIANTKHNNNPNVKEHAIAYETQFSQLQRNGKK